MERLAWLAFGCDHMWLIGDWNGSNTGRPQMVRKCLNGTAANNADLGSQGVCGDEHMVESTGGSQSHTYVHLMHMTEGKRRELDDLGII